ncbi:hypothetical protein LIER_31006 [Lithospermum erythrorhizon]|uniref:Reverse transcriptase domain-containing protein n=1 Tax=Lithospermum erythrorhizon TaxID=34254 RepID=A0AAV3RPM1_LITER
MCTDFTNLNKACRRIIIPYHVWEGWLTGEPVMKSSTSSMRRGNAWDTYKRMVNATFKNQIGKNMEIYVDDVLVKSKKRGDHLENLEEWLGRLKECRLRINLEKCSFRLKLYLGSPKLLTRPEEGEELQVYLAVSEGAVSSVLLREERGAHLGFSMDLKKTARSLISSSSLLSLWRGN